MITIGLASNHSIHVMQKNFRRRIKLSRIQMIHPVHFNSLDSRNSWATFLLASAWLMTTQPLLLWVMRSRCLVESCRYLPPIFVLLLIWIDIHLCKLLAILTSCLCVLFGHGLGFMPTCKDLLLCLDLFVLTSLVLFHFDSSPFLT